MSSKDLLKQADIAFSSGDDANGLNRLREYNANNTNDAESWHRQAVVEEQIGNWQSAGQAHFFCMDIAPNNPIAYLYLGFWLYKSKNLEAAAAAFSFAQDLDPSSLLIWQSNTAYQPTRLRSQHANEILRRFLSDHHRSICDELAIAANIKDCIWVRTHDTPFSFDSAQFAPQLFYIPSAEKKPFYTSSEFSWADSVLKQLPAIRKELNQALSIPDQQQILRPYISAETVLESSLQALAGSSDWSALDLYKDGELNSKVAENFPQTLKLISTLPSYTLDEHPFEVFFSLLKSKQTISAHYGQSNHSLTVHVPLEIPENCYLSVADQKRQWRDDELLIFDDSYLHSAHNQSDKRRIVLIFSIWHPSLSTDEQSAVQACFRARKKWLDGRTKMLNNLKQPLTQH